MSSDFGNPGGDKFFNVSNDLANLRVECSQRERLLANQTLRNVAKYLDKMGAKAEPKRFFVMEHPETDRVELLRGLDAEKRARTLIEWGLEGDPDPEIEALSHIAASGTGEYGQRFNAGRKKPGVTFKAMKPRRTRQQYEQEMRFNRINRLPLVQPRRT